MQHNTIIHAGRNIWVAGLFWKVSEASRKLDHRRLARKEDADHFISLVQSSGVLIGTANLSLTGLTPRQAGHANALAPNLLTLLGDNAWAVFELEDGGYYFVATTGGSLSLLSDITGSLEEIRKAVERYLSYTGSESASVVFCPVGFMPDLTAPKGDLNQLLATLTRERTFRLKPISTRRPVAIWSLAVLLAVAGWYGYSTWQQKQELKDLEIKRLAIENAQRLVKKDPPKPWERVPDAKSFIQTCSEGWIVQLSMAGWPFKAAMCGSDEEGIYVRLAWRKPEGGTLDPFRQRLSYFYPELKPFFNIPGEANTGGVKKPLRVINQASPSEHIGDGDEITQRVTNYAQQIQAKLVLREDNKGNVIVDGNLVDLPWRTYSFQLDTDIPPDNLFGPDIDTSGIRLNVITMTLNNARLHYSLEGTLYATR
ncbi:type 4b pilus protein PilO2 [Pectobacterium carotovorum]|uniref:type 4b pilus protein PilO2 n=1 Tax=Pectobacterium carotovorum TaxID=554 RepID=UPI0029D846AB|nr:type 4b pilus protein PilO2 [Pectobacterium carotovorum]MDX6917803.1 type 4b pilus protein PilO2 [Pectobacterium carotovorum]